jgi:hypothetical protein
MTQYLSATIVEDHVLYPIHSRDGKVQYAGHVCLWESSETEARTIAAAMCQSPVVGVEIVKSAGFGKDDVPVATIGLSFAQAESR